MRYCSNCGKPIDDRASNCPYCGAFTGYGQNPYPPNNSPYYQPQPSPDTGSAGWGVLGFFIPLADLILFLVWKDKKPKSAKSAGIGALISVCLQTAGSLIGFIVPLFLTGGMLPGLPNNL